MKIALIILLSSVTCTVSGQDVRDKSSVCLEGIKSACKEWKVDSMGLNGFREKNFVYVMPCVPQGNSKYFLDCLGQPNEKITVSTQVSLVYYLSQTKENNNQTKISFISFFLDKENKIYRVERGNILR